ncbi:MAG: dNTP triphosphohydrolase [Rhodoplanes sp.]
MAPEEHGRKEPHISVFQKDAQRIIYSTQFRRLQGKTQVHPFPVYDYLRTRLTHTIEVGNVGRIIANQIEKELARQGDLEYASCFGDITYAACLAHDLGNPPFGHVGEYAIQCWFSEMQTKSSIVAEVLSDEGAKNDFLHFDGNAQGFRILTRLAGSRDEGGLRLANATIASFCKYPYSSKYSTASKKKFGFYLEESSYADQIFQSLGMIKDGTAVYKRHPFAFITEAADDICYLTTDIDDAVRTGHVSFNTAEPLLVDICKKGDFLGRYAN